MASNRVLDPQKYGSKGILIRITWPTRAPIKRAPPQAKVQHNTQLTKPNAGGQTYTHGEG